MTCFVLFGLFKGIYAYLEDGMIYRDSILMLLELCILMFYNLTIYFYLFSAILLSYT